MWCHSKDTAKTLEVPNTQKNGSIVEHTLGILVPPIRGGPIPPYFGTLHFCGKYGGNMGGIQQEYCTNMGEYGGIWGKYGGVFLVYYSVL